MARLGGSWAKAICFGMNAACYAPVFELLLRMKATIMACHVEFNFGLDGPGLENAVLGGRTGVLVIGTSTTNPVCAAGGNTAWCGAGFHCNDAWDYIANPEGITRF